MCCACNRRDSSPPKHTAQQKDGLLSDGWATTPSIASSGDLKTMVVSHLTAVSDSSNEPSKSGVVDFGRGADAATWRMRQLQFEARALGREQVESLGRDLSAIASRAAEIAAGGEAYSVGARELCSRLADELPRKVQLLMTLAQRED